MNKYERLKAELAATGRGKMTCFGNSMLPILKSGSTCTFVAQGRYHVGDIVFCKVKGRYIDAHKITKVGPDGRFMIANNRGWENGWASEIYGRVLRAEKDGQIVASF